MYNEGMGKLHFWIMFPAFYVQSVSQMLVGLYGMRRRIGEYDPALGIENLHMLVTIAGFAIAVSVLIFIYNAVTSIRRGEQAVSNPWHSRSPEFQVASPMPAHNYDQPFEVVGEPYDYGLEGSTFVQFASEPAPATD